MDSQPPKNQKILYLRIVVTVISVVALISLFQDCGPKFSALDNQVETSSVSTPTPTPTPSPTPSPVNGACGTANGTAFSSPPTTHLCNAGTSSGIFGTGPYTWICAGIAGGTSANCATCTLATGITPPVCASSVTPVNGACGTANGQTFTTAPTTNLCSIGSASTLVTSAKTFTWSCAGTDTGTTANCTATNSGSSTAACTGNAPATVSLPLPSAASGNWFDTSLNGGTLTGLPHPTTAGVSCTTCHSSCGTGANNTIIGFDHANSAFVCNYCHDPSTKVVNLKISSGSMVNYHSSTDSQVCTCCHNGPNNPANNLPASAATAIVPSTQCSGVSHWPLVYPVYNSTTGAYSGGQFFGGQ